MGVEVGIGSWQLGVGSCTNESIAIDRRAFLQAGAPRTLAAARPVPRRRARTLESDRLQQAVHALSFEDTADLVAEVGWDGIECPVRKSVHAHRPRARRRAAAEDGGSAEEARPRSLDDHDRHHRRRARRQKHPAHRGSRLGIRKYRLGALHYVPGGRSPSSSMTFTARMRRSGAAEHRSGCSEASRTTRARLLRRAGLGCVRGDPGVPPADIGIAFDIGHATLEGGLVVADPGAPREPRYSVVYVKDFRWEKQAAWLEPVRCALGEGMVGPEVLRHAGGVEFAGPCVSTTNTDSAPHRRSTSGPLQRGLKRCADG